jgi:hypothetical protein
MAVSLVSTGLQFPDSTIQTTAASAAPTATAKGAVILTTSPSWTSSGASNYNSQAVLGSNNVFTTPLTAGFSSYLQAYPGITYITSAFYSSYYNGWFGMSGGTNYNKVPLFSPNGLSWVPVFFTYIAARAPFTSIVCIGVNDSNGTLYIMTDAGIYYSTNQGSTWTTSVTFTNNYAYVAGPPSFRYINTGTASTSKSVFTAGYYGTAYVFTAAGNSNTFASVSLGSRGYSSSTTLIANVAGYGALMYYRHGFSDFMLYSATSNTLGGNYFSTLDLYRYDGYTTPVAISSSYWIGAATTQGYLAYGTISGVTPNAGSSVLLPKFPNASEDPRIQACVYDGTRWMVMTEQGMYYSTAANPSSGWTRAQFNLGTVFFPDTTGVGAYYTAFQRDPLNS